VADAVGGYLQQILEQGDAPGDQRGDPPRAVIEVLEVGEYQANVMKMFDAGQQQSRFARGRESLIRQVHGTAHYAALTMPCIGHGR
jgi:hypothetical protein